MGGIFGWISVRDQGKGMDSKTMNHLFEPYFTTKQFGRNSGLGLMRAYGIICRHNGAIGVTSLVGSGTTVTIYLPAAKVSRTGGTP
jgi:two-component system, cell cycle sensor histidine kinase and response regulator CckA